MTGMTIGVGMGMSEGRGRGDKGSGLVRTSSGKYMSSSLVEGNV